VQDVRDGTCPADDAREPGSGGRDAAPRRSG
jgi:hypothetical protein